MVLSASKELEPETRAMLLRVEDLFRLDVKISGDTLRTMLRNLSTGELVVSPHSTYGIANNIAYGEAAAYQPGSASLDFTLGGREDRVAVEVKVGTLHLPDRGTVRVTAQAVVREAPAG
jgi:hypothetical protein